MKNIPKKIEKDISAIQKEKPLIHHITNQVVMNDTANIVLGLGAAPVMAHAKEEVEEMTTISGSLILNIGTPTPNLIESMIKAGKKANKTETPVLLDPVGAGATNLRTKSAKKILNEVNIDILKGNPGEISAIAGVTGKVKGVESKVDSKKDTIKKAEELAKKHDLTVVVTGEKDTVTDGEKTKRIENGDELLGRITGAGCMLGSVIASFNSINEDSFSAAIEGTLVYTVSAEIAANNCYGPGTFRKNLLDEIYNISWEDIKERMKIR